MKKRSIIIYLLLAAILGASIVYYSSIMSKDALSIDTSLPNNSNQEYRPPTEEEKQSGNDIKQDILENQNNQKNDPETETEKKTVNVAVTDASQYDKIVEVRAFVPNHLEDGECEIIFTKQNLKISSTTPAYTDASTTICTNPVIERSEFSESGTWQLIVKYTSESAEGESKPQGVEIN